MLQEEKTETEEIAESELLRIQREKYEAIIADKNKIIAELLNNETGSKEAKTETETEEVDEEEKAEEERRKKRMLYYKKNIF